VSVYSLLSFFVVYIEQNEMTEEKVDETQYYKMVFEDFAGEDNRIEGMTSVQSSLMLLGIDEEEVQKRFAAFCAGSKDLVALESVDFYSWLQLAKNEIK
jgi:hypothetical protein